MDTPSFEKFSITLPAEMARVIREKVSSGGYGSASELIREAMRAWLERQHRLAVLDASISRGLADADAERTRDIEEFRKELRAYRSGNNSDS